jgi:hypothetical protein
MPKNTPPPEPVHMDTAAQQHRREDQRSPHDQSQGKEGRSGEGAESAMSRMKEVEQGRQDGLTDGAPS